MNPVLKVRDVCLSYHTLSGETPALSHISFDLMPGEFLSIVGPSGCGKSTLVSLITRFYDASEGKVLVDGVDGEAHLLPVRRQLIRESGEGDVAFGNVHLLIL